MRIAIISSLIIGLLGFSAGWHFASKKERKVIENLSLIGVVDNLTVIRSIQTGDTEGVLFIADASIEGHLNKIREYAGANNSKEFQKRKIHILNGVGIVWQNNLFSSADWRENKYAWNKVWRKPRKENIELIQWAKDQCKNNPDITCRTSWEDTAAGCRW